MRGHPRRAGRARQFRDRPLLGGQAARAELSCESCHSNGRGNDAFHFPGLSGEPGTADVTSSIMSSYRGNARFDPRPIPDLAAAGKISRDPAKGELEAFIRGLVVEEFDGAEPSSLVLRGLADYVRALGPCDAPRESVTAAGMLDDSRRATIAAGHAWARGDVAGTRLLVSAARSMLGRIDERYAADGLAADRAALRSADLGLLAIARAVDRRAVDVPARLAAWRSDLPRWAPALLRNEPRSLFNPTLLEAALSR